MTTLKSYDLNGKKLSFANWISNISPMDTPFTSMTRKESINQVLFQWQIDYLADAAENANSEGSPASPGDLRKTGVHKNITQILNKTIKVSDTSNAMANYGRGKEIKYQMEKAAKEIKRDLEWAFLNNGTYSEETATEGRKTSGYLGLIAAKDSEQPGTKAIVHKTWTGDLTESKLFDLTHNLYLSGSRADIIMYHPEMSIFFSSLQEGGRAKERIFENTPKLSVYVGVITDPLGQQYRLIPNRWMPKEHIYFFNSDDFTQMVLRNPSRTQLAKDGSFEKWMIEVETGLRLRNPFAAGCLRKEAVRVRRDIFEPGSKFVNGNPLDDGYIAVDIPLGSQLNVKMKLKDSLSRQDSDDKAHILVYKDDSLFSRKEDVLLGQEVTLTLHNTISKGDEGSYVVKAETLSYEDEFTITVGVDDQSQVDCDTQAFIDTATFNRADILINGESYSATAGDMVPDLFELYLKDEGYGSEVTLYKMNGTDKLTTVDKRIVVDHYSYGFTPLQITDAGRYQVHVAKDNCVQKTEICTVGVKTPVVHKNPFVAGGTRVFNTPLLDSDENPLTLNSHPSSEVLVTSQIETESAPIHLSIVAEMDGAPVFEQGSQSTGVSNLKFNTSPSLGSTKYFVKATLADKTVFYTKPFIINVIPKDSDPTPSSNLFDPTNSYVGDMQVETINEGGISIETKTDNLNGEFFVFYERGDACTYQLVSKSSDKSKNASVRRVSVPQTGHHYAYLTDVVWTEENAGSWQVRASRGSEFQTTGWFDLEITK